MMRLLKSEYQKLGKRKFTVVLLIALFAYSGYQIYQTYHATAASEIMAMTYETTDHQKVANGLAYYRYADEYLHQYAGPFNEDTIQKMKEDYQKIMKKYQRKNIDTEKMERIYGKDWESFLKGAATSKYMEEDVRKRMERMNIDGYGMDDKGNYFFNVFYKEDPVYMLYQRIYTGHSQYATSHELYGENAGQISSEIVDISVNQYLPRFLKGAGAEKELFENAMHSGEITNASSRIAKKYQEELQQGQLQYDSTVGNHLLLTNLNKIDFVSLLVIIIVLSDMFAQETHYKTDQILIPTKEGAKRLVIAKLLCGMSLAIGILFLQLCMIVLAEFIFVPLRSLDLTVFPQADAGYYEMIRFIFTYREVLVSTFFLTLIAAMAIGMVTMAISYFSKNRFATAILMLVFMILSFAINFRQDGWLAYLCSLFPSHMLEVNTFYSWMNGGFSPFIIFMDMIIPWKHIVCVLWIILMIILSVIIIQRYQKHFVKSH